MENSKKKLCIGVDVSKGTVDIFYKSKSYKISNNKKSISAFIKKEIKNATNLFCVMESTGGYERVIAKTFMQHLMPVHIAHPSRIHAFAKACGHFAKTDKLDAILIHKYAEFISEKESGQLEIDENHQDILALRRLAKATEANLHAAQCKIKQMPSLCTSYLRRDIKFYKSQLKSIQIKINEMIDGNPALKIKQDILISVKGVGKKTASILLAELPELGTLSRKKIANLVGVAPQTYQSGKKSVAGHITGGRFDVRKALYMVVLVGIKHNALIKKRYEAFLERGKAKKVAIVALMRNVIITLNAMVRNGEKYKIIV